MKAPRISRLGKVVSQPETSGASTMCRRREDLAAGRQPRRSCSEVRSAELTQQLPRAMRWIDPWLADSIEAQGNDAPLQEPSVRVERHPEHGTGAKIASCVECPIPAEVSEAVGDQTAAIPLEAA